MVVKISGSLVYPPRPEYLEGLASILRGAAEKRRIVAVVGGGELARTLIKALSGIGAGQGLLDMIGIESSRLNARLLAYSLYPLAPPRPPESPGEILELSSLYPIVVAGGLQPGQSTNAVAMVAAELVGADTVVNLLNGVPGVYRRYPPEPEEAPASCMSTRELWKVVGGYEQVAGRYRLLDHIALSIAERSGIRIVFADGSDLSTVEAILLRGEIRGTLVSPSGCEG
ncbi:MAG: UMP kinase [Desulfurococcales archaeon]|nr:UMP kinase [Desulfurococcales archaeon]